MWYNCKVIVLVFGKVMGMGFLGVLGNGFHFMASFSP